MVPTQFRNPITPLCMLPRVRRPVLRRGKQSPAEVHSRRRMLRRGRSVALAVRFGLWNIVSATTPTTSSSPGDDSSVSRKTSGLIQVRLIVRFKCQYRFAISRAPDKGAPARPQAGYQPYLDQPSGAVRLITFPQAASNLLRQNSPGPSYRYLI
jgi:hypothetical protein